MSATYNFSGYQILVTGAGKGIGRAIVKDLYNAKASKIFAVTRTESDLVSLINETDKNVVIPVVCDLNQSINKISDILVPVFENNEIDHLVNNAGIGILEPFLDIKEESWDKIYQVNLKAAVFISQMFAKSYQKRFKNKNFGTIVNISSQASVACLDEHLVYCSCKAALDMAGRMMAKELSGPFNLRINNINPTVVLTDLGRMAWSDPEKAGPMKSKIPLDRFAEVEEVVRPVMFLLSKESSMVNGSNMYIDGGFVNTN